MIYCETPKNVDGEFSIKLSKTESLSAVVAVILVNHEFSLLNVSFQGIIEI